MTGIFAKLSNIDCDKFMVGVVIDEKVNDSMVVMKMLSEMEEVARKYGFELDVKEIEKRKWVCLECGNIWEA